MVFVLGDVKRLPAALEDVPKMRGDPFLFRAFFLPHEPEMSCTVVFHETPFSETKQDRKCPVLFLLETLLPSGAPADFPQANKLAGI